MGRAEQSTGAERVKGELSRSLTTRQAWIDAGYEALGDSGLDGVSIEALADRLGVSKAGFYHRFANRRELLDEIVGRWVDHGAELMERGARIVDPRDQIFEVGVDAITDTRLRRADVWLLLRSPAAPEHAASSREVREQILEWVAGLVRRLGFSDEEAQIRARVIYVGYIGLTADIEATEPTPSDDTIRAHMANLVRIATQV